MKSHTPNTTMWHHTQLTASPSVPRTCPCLTSSALLDAGTDEIEQQQNLRNPGQGSSSFSSCPIAPAHQHPHQATSNGYNRHPALQLPTKQRRIFVTSALDGWKPQTFLACWSASSHSARRFLASYCAGVLFLLSSSTYSAWLRFRASFYQTNIIIIWRTPLRDL